MDGERMGIVAEAARRCEGLVSGELDCGWEVGDPNLPQTLNEGLDVVVVVGNANIRSHQH